MEDNKVRLFILDYVHDGDTIRGTIVHSKHAREYVYIRLADIDAPELPTQAGIQSANYLKSILPKQFKIQMSGDGDYGRTLATIYLDDDTNVNEKMIELGYAVKYV